MNHFILGDNWEVLKRLNRESVDLIDRTPKTLAQQLNLF
jgi:hypothetical protein